MIADLGRSCRRTSGASVGLLHACCVGSESSDASVYVGRFVFCFAEAQKSSITAQLTHFAVAVADPIGAAPCGRSHRGAPTFRSVRTCGSLQCVFNQAKSECLCFSFSLLLRAGLDPSASPNEIKFSKEMFWQEIGALNDTALTFSDT